MCSFLVGMCNAIPSLAYSRKETSPIVTIYKGAKMLTELYDTLAKAKLPTPTVQQLTYNLPISYLGMLIQQKNDHLSLSQPGYINDLLTKYPPAKRFKNPCTEDISKPPLSELETPLINITIFAASCLAA